MPESPAQQTFRHVLGHLPTGVAVLTSDRGEGGPVGMAVNSITAVSLDPPLVLVCPAKSSTTWPSLRDSGRFCVNVMGSAHQQTARNFALKDADRFSGVEHHSRACGPGLDRAVAWIDCRIDAEHDAGDHTIVVAAVEGLEAARADVEPLVFFRGEYGTFAYGGRKEPA